MIRPGVLSERDADELNRRLDRLETLAISQVMAPLTAVKTVGGTAIGPPPLDVFCLARITGNDGGPFSGGGNSGQVVGTGSHTAFKSGSGTAGMTCGPKHSWVQIDFDITACAYDASPGLSGDFIDPDGWAIDANGQAVPDGTHVLLMRRPGPNIQDKRMNGFYWLILAVLSPTDNFVDIVVDVCFGTFSGTGTGTGTGTSTATGSLTANGGGG